MVQTARQLDQSVPAEPRKIVRPGRRVSAGDAEETLLPLDDRQSREEAVQRAWSKLKELEQQADEVAASIRVRGG